MTSDAGPELPPARGDRDVVDFTWLSNLLRRLSRRLYPAKDRRDAAPAEGADAGAGERPEPDLTPPAREAPPAGQSSRRDELGPAGSSGQLRRFGQGYGVPLALALAVAVIALNNHFRGVDWGDDFALYMRQAEALVTGNIGEVLRENRFTVDNSGWRSFSPYSYPWGWPLIVAPFFVVFGLDYEVFKSLEVVALSTFVFFFFLLVRPRVGTLVAVVLTLLIGLSPSYVGGTDSVLSDLPYLCFVGLTLWWIERCRLKGMLACSRRDLVILGLVMGFTFNVRREGIAVFAALAALHAAVLLGVAVRGKGWRTLRTVEWRRVSLPYLTAAAFIVAFHLLLPTVLFPDLPGTGLQNASRRLEFYREAVAEHVGLKDAGAPMKLLGQEVLATRAVFLLGTFAAVGVVARLLLRFEEDVAPAAYLCASGFIMLVSPYQDGRYLYTITPWVAYFAYQALPAVASLAEWRPPALRRLAVVLPAVALSGLIVLNARDLAHATSYKRQHRDILHGPESPAAKEMFAAVEEITRGDDVVLFFRARAMTLYTDRSAIQGADLDQLLKRVDWYVMERDSTYSQTPLTDDEAAGRRLTKAWENSRWVIWEVPAPAP